MRTFKVLVISLLFVLTIPPVVFSQTLLNSSQIIPPEVEQAAQNGLIYFNDSIINAPGVFNITPSDNAKTSLHLGSGYPFYRVSSNAINSYDSTNAIPTIEQLFNTIGGYIYPIYVGNKPIGIGFVENVDGAWTMVQVSSNNTFENDLAKAQKHMQLNHGNIKNQRVIYDQSLAIAATAIQSDDGEFITGLSKTSFDLKPFESKTLKDFTKTISDINKDSTKHPGTIGGPSLLGGVKNQLSIIPIITVILLLVVSGMLMYKNLVKKI